MGRVIYCTPVEQYKVLVCCTTPHVKSAGSLSNRLHSRKGKDNLNHIRLSEHHRNILHPVHPHFLYTHLACPHLIGILCRDHHSRQGIHFLLHYNIKRTLAVHLKVHLGILKGITAHIQHRLAHRKQNFIESVGIRLRIRSGSVVYKGNTHNRLTCYRIPHIAAQISLS